MTGEKVLQPFQDSDRKLVALFNGNWAAHLGRRPGAEDRRDYPAFIESGL